MARVLLLLGALLREVRRESEGFLALGRNHFGAFALLLFVVAPPAAAALQGLLLLLVLPALGRDPLHLLPKDRLALLPMGRCERILFRLFARLLNSVFLGTLILSWLLRWNPFWVIPWIVVLPPIIENLAWRFGSKPRSPRRFRLSGRFGPFFLQSLKSYLRSLDPYLGFLLSVWGVGQRIWGSVAIPGLEMGVSLLIVLSLGTQAQCLLGAESAGERLRLKLIPVRGWQLFLLRDAAWLTLLLPLVAPHDWQVGLGAGFTALMVGHRASLCPAPRKRPGHFLQGPSLGLGALQTGLMAVAGIGLYRFGSWLFIPILTLWALSLWMCGKRLDQRL